MKGVAGHDGTQTPAVTLGHQPEPEPDFWPGRDLNRSQTYPAGMDRQTLRQD